MMEQRKVLPVGAQVQLARVDEYGFCGRENHPERKDVGFVGFVTRFIELGDDEGAVYYDEQSEQIFHGMTLWPGEYVVYEVRSPDGRTLWLCDHEIEVLKG